MTVAVKSEMALLQEARSKLAQCAGLISRVHRVLRLQDGDDPESQMGEISKWCSEREAEKAQERKTQAEKPVCPF